MKKILELLQSATPGNLLTTWRDSGELASYLPEVNRLFGVPQNAEHHPEVDTGIHIALCLDMAHRLNASLPARFAVLLHDLGKGLTPVDELPMHVNHEKSGLAPVEQLCERLGVPDYWRKLALLVCEFHLHSHRAFEMRSKSMLRFLSVTGMETDKSLLEDFLAACEADKRGRLGRAEQGYTQGSYMRDAALALQGLHMAAGVRIEGRELSDLHAARLSAVRNAGSPYRQAIEAARALKAVC